MEHLFTTTALTEVVPTLLRSPNNFILDKWFGRVKTFDTASVLIDVQHARRRVAAFCAPNVEGKVVEEAGWESNEFTPAYIKEKTPLTPYRAIERTLGETYGGGEVTPMEKMILRIGWTIQDHLDAIDRRKNLMAIEAMVKGTVTCKGEGYQAKTVNFKRKPTLTFLNVGNDQWDGSDADPLSDLQNWISTVKRAEGAVIDDIVMDIDSWEYCWRSEKFRFALDNRHLAISDGMGPTSGALMIGPSVSADGVEWKGKIGTLNIYVYDDVYEDPDTGIQRPYLEPGTVIGGCAEIRGVQLQGAILDEDANLQAKAFHVKSKLEFDPPARIILTQSAPLVVPQRPNASFSAKVLS